VNAAASYGITSIHFQAALGGVIEYGFCTPRATLESRRAYPDVTIPEDVLGTTVVAGRVRGARVSALHEAQRYTV
jgi:hypothetical protein